jgi:hypothetical protein
MSTHTRRVRAVPLLVGSSLLMASCLLVSEDVLHGHPLTVTTAIQPLLVIGATAAAVLAHHRAASWSLLSALVFGALALAGSGLVVFNALARTAAAQDTQHAAAMRVNRALDAKMGELKAAQTAAAAECRSGLGPKCRSWQQRVDTLMSETNQMEVRALDPRADSIVAMAILVGFDGEHARKLVQAFGPASLPVWIELAAAAFLASAFPAVGNRQQFRSVPAEDCGSVPVPLRPWSQQEALADFRALRSAGSQQFLAERWGRAESTVSRWLAEWQSSGAVSRARIGKEKVTRLALPAPRQ